MDMNSDSQFSSKENENPRTAKPAWGSQAARDGDPASPLIERSDINGAPNQRRDQETRAVPAPARSGHSPSMRAGHSPSVRPDTPDNSNSSSTIHVFKNDSITPVFKNDSITHVFKKDSKTHVFKEADAGIDLMYKMGGSIVKRTDYTRKAGDKNSKVVNGHDDDHTRKAGDKYQKVDNDDHTPKAGDKDPKVDNDRDDDQLVPIMVNYFPVILEEKPTFIHHYDVELNPSCNSKPMNRRLKYLLQRDQFDGELIGYDGQKNMFIAESTLRKKDYLDRKEIEFKIIPCRGANSYEMKLRRVNVLGDIGLRYFLMGGVAKNPSYYRRALEVIMREGPNSSRFCYTVNNASYYWDPRGQFEKLRLKDDGDLLGNGGYSIAALKGFIQSLRAVDRGLTLNLDSASMAFHRKIKLAQYLEGRGIGMWTLQVLDTNIPHRRDDAKQMLAGLYVDVLHRTTYKKYKIADISEKPASKCQLRDGSTVVNYFQQNYPDIKVFENLLCVIVRGDPYKEEKSNPRKEKNNPENEELLTPLPIEDCVIADEQTCTEAYSGYEKNIRKLRQLAGGDPLKRYEMIRESFTILSRLCGDGKEVHNKCGDEKEIHNKLFSSLKLFGIDIGKEMISVTGRLIPEPRLMSNAERFSRKEPNIRKVNRGQWRMKTVYSAGRSLKPHEWDVIEFSDQNQPMQMKTMINQLLETCTTMSIKSFEAQQKDYDLWIDTSNLKKHGHIKTLEEALKSLKKNNLNRLSRVSFVFCVFERKLKKFFYEAVKRICDTEMGWITQCCMMAYLKLSDKDHKRKGYPYAITYRKNVSLKLNAKLGGVNTVLEESKLLEKLFGSNSQVILFGTDVIHPLKNKNLNDELLENQNINDNTANDDPDIVMEIADAANDSQTEKQDVKSGRPNLAVMVASMHWSHLTQYRARVRGLPPEATQCKIRDQLSVMAKELLDAHIKANAAKNPTSAIFFRDAVSDGEFQSLRAEFRQLRQTLKSECPEIKSTMIVVRRNHNTRFFSKDIDKEGKEIIKNAEAGTVVDSDITRPRPTRDFYLASQSIQENSLELPTYYLLLHDEIRLCTKLKELENFLYYLCHTHATSTKTVAVVPPLLYAHQVASRAGASFVSGNDSDSQYPHPNLIDTMYFC